MPKVLPRLHQAWDGDPGEFPVPTGWLHILEVRSVTPPAGTFDDGELDYELHHPPACRMGEWHGMRCLYWTCDVGENEANSGLAFSLRYSGTPITEPGRYLIQGWATKTYSHYYGAYEYDASVGVVGRLS